MTTRPAFTSSAAAVGDAAAAEAKAGEERAIRSAPVIPPAPDGFPTLRREAGEHTMSSAIRDFNGPPCQLMVGICPRDGKASFLSRVDAKQDAGVLADDSCVTDVRTGKRFVLTREDTLRTPGAVIRVWRLNDPSKEPTP